MESILVHITEVEKPYIIYLTLYVYPQLFFQVLLMEAIVVCGCRHLKMLTLPSISRLRDFTNSTLLDILYFTSPLFCQVRQLWGAAVNLPSCVCLHVFVYPCIWMDVWSPLPFLFVMCTEEVVWLGIVLAHTGLSLLIPVFPESQYYLCNFRKLWCENSRHGRNTVPIMTAMRPC